jgi:hypothetical protein
MFSPQAFNALLKTLGIFATRQVYFATGRDPQGSIAISARQRSIFAADAEPQKYLAAIAARENIELKPKLALIARAAELGARSLSLFDHRACRWSRACRACAADAWACGSGTGDRPLRADHAGMLGSVLAGCGLNTHWGDPAVVLTDLAGSPFCDLHEGRSGRRRRSRRSVEPRAGASWRSGLSMRVLLAAGNVTEESRRSRMRVGRSGGDGSGPDRCGGSTDAG